MPERLMVAVAQPPNVSHAVEANALAHAASVRAAGARVVVIPEMSLTGYELGAAMRERSTSRHTWATTVVCHPPRFSTPLVSEAGLTDWSRPMTRPWRAEPRAPPRPSRQNSTLSRSACERGLGRPQTSAPARSHARSGRLSWARSGIVRTA